MGNVPERPFICAQRIAEGTKQKVQGGIHYHPDPMPLPCCINSKVMKVCAKARRDMATTGRNEICEA